MHDDLSLLEDRLSLAMAVLKLLMIYLSLKTISKPDQLD